MNNHKSNGRKFLGILLIALGLIFFGNNLDLFDFDIAYHLFRWQNILILIGLITLVNSRRSFTGYILILIGGGSLIANYYDYSLWEIFDNYWPIILIAIGFYIIYRRGEGTKKKNHKWCSDQDQAKEYHNCSFKDHGGHNYSYSEVSDDNIDITTVFSAQKILIKSQQFSGGKTTSVFGGVELDLRDAKLAPGNNVIDSFTLFGATEVLVPYEWKLSVNVVVLFGGVDDQRHGRTENIPNEGPTLVLKGLTLFGGTEIKYV